jgi:hypothetical protein
MPVLAPQFTQRGYFWTQWLEVRALKGLVLQYEGDDDTYTIWGYDGPEVHICTIWRGLVPDAVLGEGYTQEQNDADEAEFEAAYKPTGNLPLQSVRSDGVLRVQLEPADVLKRLCVQGFKLDCTTLASGSPPVPGKSSVELDWAYTIDFQGLDGVWVVDFDPRDYMEMYAVLEAGTPRAVFEAVTGQAWPFGGATETPVDIDIFQFGISIYVPPTGVTPSFVADSSFTVPQFIKLRLDYFAFSETVTPKLTGVIRIWKTP